MISSRMSCRYASTCLRHLRRSDVKRPVSANEPWCTCFLSPETAYPRRSGSDRGLQPTYLLIWRDRSSKLCVVGITMWWCIDRQSVNRQRLHEQSWLVRIDSYWLMSTSTLVWWFKISYIRLDATWLKFRGHRLRDTGQWFCEEHCTIARRHQRVMPESMVVVAIISFNNTCQLLCRRKISLLSHQISWINYKSD